MSTTPKNSWELFKWVFTEPVKLKAFLQTKPEKNNKKLLLKTYFLILMFSLFLYSFLASIIFIFDIPFIYSNCFQIGTSPLCQFMNEFHHTYPILLDLIILTIFLIFIFLISILLTLVKNIVWGVTLCCLFHFSIPIVMILPNSSLEKTFIINLIGGIILTGYLYPEMKKLNGIPQSISNFIIGILALLFAVSMALLSSFSDKEDNIVSIILSGVMIGFLFVYYGFHSYLYHFIKYQFLKPSLKNNPYLADSFIYTPILGLQKYLSLESFQQPNIAKHFINFLFEYRLHQRQLAFHLSNVVNASKLYHNPLKNTIEVPKDYEKEQPTESFTDHLTQYKNELNIYYTQNNLQFKKESLQDIIKILKKLEEDMIKETRGWREYYLKAIRKNLEVAHSELRNLELKLANNEPIQANIYRVGEPLSPNDKTKTFKGRIDLKDALSRVVHTSTTMPLLFIQGQRRVGKTSLINYLEVLLGSGFKIIKIDMQQARNKKFIKLLENLNKQINTKLGIDEIVEFNGDTTDNWIAFEEYLERHTKKLNYKLIIAFDEYENFHRNIASQEPEILEYMRGFLQNQEQVVFLFVGLRDISELTQPNWDEYFPQIQKLRVDYLSSEDSKELITHPVPEFSLVYDDSVVEAIIELTQGHPQLLQTICSIIVDIANAKGIKDINQAILDEAKGKIFETNEAPMTIFWREYCDDTQRAIIEQILANEAITQETKEQKRALMRLKEYGFITADNQIRVPLFEKWLIERRELIEIGAKS